MNIKEFKEVIENYPDNYKITVDYDPGLCDVENVDIDWNNNRIILYTY